MVTAGSEKQMNFIIKLLENQTSTPKHRWTKIMTDPKFPDAGYETPFFALGATRPILTKDKDYYTSVLAAWAFPIMQAFHQIQPGTEDCGSSNYSVTKFLNSRVGASYPTLSSHIG